MKYENKTSRQEIENLLYDFLESRLAVDNQWFSFEVFWENNLHQKTELNLTFQQQLDVKTTWKWFTFWIRPLFKYQSNFIATKSGKIFAVQFWQNVNYLFYTMLVEEGKAHFIWNWQTLEFLKFCVKSFQLFPVLILRSFSYFGVLHFYTPLLNAINCVFFKLFLTKILFKNNNSM